jgi:hypothetical protein
MTKIAAILAVAIWMFSFAPAYAQGMTEYLGTTGQSQGLSSIGSAIGNQFHGAGHVIDSGNTTQTYDSNSEDQSQMVDSARSSGSLPLVVKGPVKDVPVQDAQKPDPIDYTHNPNLGY